MKYELSILLPVTASIGVFHTLVGPDHYLPFVCMARSGNWSRRKTCWIVGSCALGHVISSIVIGLIGISLGLAMANFQGFENFRGNFAAWMLIVFGGVYFLWGCFRVKQKHLTTFSNQRLTPFILFLIFVMGPCEPLIPLLLYPAVKHSFAGLLMVTAAFTLTTILTMMAIVVLLLSGLKKIKIGRFERYSDILGGALICFTGIAIQLYRM